MPEIGIDVNLGETHVISVPATAAGGLIVAGKARLIGWSLRETTGAAPASGRFTSGGNLIGAFGVGAGLGTTDSPGGQGIKVRADITLTVTTGTIEGAVYIEDLDY